MHTLQAKWFFFFTLLKVNYRLIYILAAPVGGSSVAPPRARSSAPALPGSLSSRWSSTHLSLTSHQHTLSSIRGQPERAEVLTNSRSTSFGSHLEMLHRREGDTGTKMQQLWLFQSTDEPKNLALDGCSRHAVCHKPPSFQIPGIQFRSTIKLATVALKIFSDMSFLSEI